jgi:glycosyltransferase involved in cell wall biosynthesis
MFAGAGSSIYISELLDKAQKLGVEDLVKYRGVLTHAESLRMQNECSIGLVPDLPAPNNLAAIPTKMLECMMLGLPLVYSDLPNYAEIAANASAGLPFQSGNPESLALAIMVMIQDPARAKQFGEMGRRAVLETYNWARESESLITLYSQVLHS